MFKLIVCEIMFVQYIVFFSNYITVPEFPCNRKELKLCLTAGRVLTPGVTMLNITTSECTHRGLHCLSFLPTLPPAGGGTQKGCTHTHTPRTLSRRDCP